jgi:hypothetical protein
MVSLWGCYSPRECGAVGTTKHIVTFLLARWLSNLELAIRKCGNPCILHLSMYVMAHLRRTQIRLVLYW